MFSLHLVISRTLRLKCSWIKLNITYTKFSISVYVVLVIFLDINGTFRFPFPVHERSPRSVPTTLTSHKFTQVCVQFE